MRGVIRAKGSPGHVSVVLADRGTRTADAVLPPAPRLTRSSPRSWTGRRSRRVDCCTWTASMPPRPCRRSSGPARRGCASPWTASASCPGSRTSGRGWICWCAIRASSPRSPDTPSLEDGLRELAARGPSRVAVTLAERGVLGADRWPFHSRSGIPGGARGHQRRRRRLSRRLRHGRIARLALRSGHSPSPMRWPR